MKIKPIAPTLTNESDLKEAQHFAKRCGNCVHIQTIEASTHYNVGRCKKYCDMVSLYDFKQCHQDFITEVKKELIDTNKQLILF